MSTISEPEREARAQIAETEEAEAERGRAARAAGLFDLRRVIGGLLTVYGIVLTVMGLFASEESRTKAAGLNINLWAGIAILAAGVAFLAWAALRPLRAEDLEAEADDADRPPVE
jgi:cation transport ATPase